ncbi:MAG: M2 family metallopeptidase [Anaerolineae bacterium]|nr:M2 family metallopeptidase [Anaerolineae bacterium]
MSDAVQAAVNKVTAKIRAITIDFGLAEWEAATTGTDEALNAAAEAEAAMMHFWANPDDYQQYKTWDESGAAGDDAQLKRMVHLLHYAYAEGQRDASTIQEMTELSKALNDAFTNFRAEVDGQRLTNNAIMAILRDENDSGKRRAAWEGSKQVGVQIADTIRRLAELRNEAAQHMGYENFHRMSLTLNELDPDWLYSLLDDLAAKTEAPFRKTKAAMDVELSKRFGVSVEDLMPWHYADPFFQEAPMLGDLDFDRLFEGKDLEELAIKTYDGLGMEIRDIIARSDLYEREGKDQHAFCTHIDREGDIRVLSNLKPNLRWMDTLLHEMGHAVYDKYIPQDLPWLLCTVPHILTTEAMALLMGSVTLDPEWHEQILGVPAGEAAKVIKAGAERFRLEALIFARWVLVVVNFERLLYEDPSRDLNAAWWDLVEKYQMLIVPEGRKNKPDWAAKYHIALAPAYYQNYQLGRMMSLQWDAWLRDNSGGIVGRRRAGEFFRARIFAPGNTMHWNDALEFATGEKLNPDYFAKKFTS